MLSIRIYSLKCYIQRFSFYKDHFMCHAFPVILFYVLSTWLSDEKQLPMKHVLCDKEWPNIFYPKISGFLALSKTSPKYLLWKNNQYASHHIPTLLRSLWGKKKDYICHCLVIGIEWQSFNGILWCRRL